MNKETHFTENFFRRLDDLLHQNGWTYNRLSTESGISLNAIYQMRKRNSLPTLQTLYDICSAFNISLAEFFIFESTIDQNAIKIIERLNQLSSTSVAVLASLVDCLK